MEAIEKKTKAYFKYALTFDLPVENISNLSLFDFISDWYGTRYIFGGSSKKGIDCSAFTRQLAKDVLSMDLPRKAQEQFSKCARVEKHDLKPGDLVFFETYQKGISHVGYYLGDNKFIHAASHKGVTIDNLEDPYYKKAFRSGGRLRQME
jgi:lipoprotein Spr